MEKKVLFSEYLLDQYLKWVKEQKEAKSTAEFASAVGISRQTLNHLMEKGTNNIPRPKTVYALARVIGPGIYEFLGLDRASVELEIVKQTWKNLPDKERGKVLEIVQPYEG